MNNIDFTVIVDTREQQPWTLKYHSTAIQKLDTGDYSVQGYEDLICIERKHSISEFVSNMSEKRFLDVLNRMTKYKYSYIVMEFNFDDVLNFPIGSDIPKKCGIVSKFHQHTLRNTLRKFTLSTTYTFCFVDLLLVRKRWPFLS